MRNITITKIENKDQRASRLNHDIFGNISKNYNFLWNN